MDWKDQLAKLSGNYHSEENIPETEGNAPEEETGKKVRETPVTVIHDRKGRKGKCATIIEGFDMDEDVKGIAAELKRRLATGGSVRDSDILIQGERGPEVVKILSEMGFKTKRQNF